MTAPATATQPGLTEAERTRALSLACAVAREVGREVQLPRLPLGAAPAGLEKKGVRDLVTEADRLSEERILAAIRASFPHHKIFAEETVRETAAPGEHVWYIDPLDGTTNFVHGLPIFCVSIACYGPRGGEVAAVYAPYFDEMYSAARGGGAFLEGGPTAQGSRRRLAVSDARSLEDATLVTGFAYDMERFPNGPRFARMLPKTRALRRFGSAALDLAYVAAGRFDGMWEAGLNPFDAAAGALLIEEAGGIVTDYAGGPGWLFGRTLLASGRALHGELRRELGEG